MLKLETNRLLIIPLSVEQLELFLLKNGSLEKEMNLLLSEHEHPEGFLNSIQSKIIPAMRSSVNNLYFDTIWTIIDKESNCAVADLCFKGAPNELGEVEIGYGTHTNYENNGFMTEAVGGIVNWALEQEDVLCIWAETDPNNLASQKVLTKNNFEQIDETPENIYWRISKTVKNA